MNSHIRSVQSLPAEGFSSQAVGLNTHTRRSETPPETQAVLDTTATQPVDDQQQFARHRSYELQQSVSFKSVVAVDDEAPAKAALTVAHDTSAPARVPGNAIRLRRETKEQLSERAEIAIDVIDYYSRHADDYDASKRRYQNSPKLDLEKGMNVVYAKMLANAGSPTDNAKMLELVSKLTEDPNYALSESDQQLLQGYGLAVQGGQLINYVTRERVSAQDISDFQHIHNYQSQKAAAVSENNGVSRPFVGNILAAAELAETHLLNQQNLLADRLAALGLKRERLEADLESGRAQMSQLQNQQTVLNSQMEQANLTLELLNGLENASDLQQFFLNATPEQRALLEQLGITIQGDGDQITITQNGQPLSAQAALSLVREGVQAQVAQLQTSIEQTRTQLAEFEAQVSDIESQLQDIESDAAVVSMIQRNLEQATVGYESSIADLRQLRNDPEAWAQLSPDEQSRIEGLLGRYAGNMARTQSLQTAATQELEAVASLREEASVFVQEARELISATQNMLQAADQVLLNLTHALERLEQQIQRLEGSPETQKAQELIAEANDLASRLELMPSFDQMDVSELIAEWEKILKEAQATYSRWSKQQQANQDIENVRMQAFSKNMLERADYHLETLQNMVQQRSTEMRDYLQSSLQDLVQVLGQTAHA